MTDDHIVHRTLRWPPVRFTTVRRVTIFLVRHAHAGKRSEWNGDDEHRPLSERGNAQSSAITGLLVDAGVGRVVSSPYLRCVQTMQPIARLRDLEVELDDRMAEGAGLHAALELLLSLDPVDGVACTHGDLIPEMIGQLAEQGMEIDGPILHQKGSVWTIETDDGRPARGRYTPPST